MCGKIHTLLTYMQSTGKAGPNTAPLQITLPGSPPVRTKIKLAKNSLLTFNEKQSIKLLQCPGKALLNIELLNADDLRLASATDTVENVTIWNMMSVYELRNYSKQLMSKTSISFQWHDRNKMRSEKSTEKDQKLTQWVAVFSSVSERPRLFRVGFYYETGKNAMGFSKIVPLIKKYDQWSENGANFVLRKLSVKGMNSFTALDCSLAPFLVSVNQTVGEKLTWGLEQLAKEQEKILTAKDTTLETVGNVVQSTTTSVRSMTDATYKTVSGGALYILSYVPIVGRKFEA
jgi:hypothetical protein